MNAHKFTPSKQICGIEDCGLSQAEHPTYRDIVIHRLRTGGSLEAWTPCAEKCSSFHEHAKFEEMVPRKTPLEHEHEKLKEDLAIQLRSAKIFTDEILRIGKKSEERRLVLKKFQLLAAFGAFSKAGTEQAKDLATTLQESHMAVQCCERDHNADGSCDRHGSSS